MYDCTCNTCGALTADVLIRGSEFDPHMCHKCGGTSLKPCFPNTRVIGAMPSKPIDGGTQTFATNKEYRDWQKANPDLRILSDDNPIYKRHRRETERQADAAAVRAGYRSTGHRREQMKIANKRKRELEG